ncbi:hypothetical protein GGE68_002677 [Rhizobium leguminosarum]|uniref:hypothetical protein n=1 Tax=Rhizobium leguminosarum TaxID=384 RepID=UPI001608624E|nr:hypothetical protein [Rhizobium leguminosarum]MBB5664486.1 hypothetical protein [Rhizobium leguminosarum]
MSRILATLALVLCFTRLAVASTQELDKAVMSATHFGMVQMGVDNRKALAKAGLAYWENFDSRIPRNPPTVLDWLKNEMRTTDTVRIGRLTATSEYALWTLAETSTLCVNLFRSANELVGRGGFNELYIWTKTLGCYDSQSNLLLYLKQARLSDGKEDGAFNLQHFNLYHKVVTGVVANTIMDEAQNLK